MALQSVDTDNSQFICQAEPPWSPGLTDVSPGHLHFNSFNSQGFPNPHPHPGCQHASFRLNKWQLSHSPAQDQTLRGILNFSPSLTPYIQLLREFFQFYLQTHLEYDCINPSPWLPHYVWSASSLGDICKIASQWASPLLLCLPNQQLEWFRNKNLVMWCHFYPLVCVKSFSGFLLHLE